MNNLHLVSGSQYAPDKLEYFCWILSPTPICFIYVLNTHVRLGYSFILILFIIIIHSKRDISNQLKLARYCHTILDLMYRYTADRPIAISHLEETMPNV